MTMNLATYVAYVDESGDVGFRFGEGSSRWFVLSAVILRRSVEMQELMLVDELRAKINSLRPPERWIPDKKPLHFRDLGHEQRRFFARRMAFAKLKSVTVLIDKTMLGGTDYQDATRLYQHAVRLVAECVSRYCLANTNQIEEGDGSAQLVLSNQASMDYDALRRSMQHLEDNRLLYSYRAEPNIIRPDQIETYTSGRRIGFQLADAVAGSYYFALEVNNYGMTEESYLRDLLPCAVNYRGNILGFGVVLYPVAAEESYLRREILAGFDL